MPQLHWTTTHTTEWDGHAFQLQKRSTQDSKGNWGKPKWFLYAAAVPDDPEDDHPVMSSLGRYLGRAKQLAELHLVHGWEFSFQIRPSDGVELWRKDGAMRPLDELLAGDVEVAT